MSASVHKNGAECVVLGAVFRFFASCHWLQPVRDKGTGQGTWDLTDFSERRILSAKNSGGHGSCRAEILRSGRSPTLQTTICHSLFATHHSLPFYHSPSPFATRYSPVANHCRSQHKPRPPKFVHRKIWERGEEGEMACGKFGFQFDCKQPLRNALDCSRLAWA
jgi:hypothetical protein